MENNKSTNPKFVTTGNDAPDECSICYEAFTNKAFASDCLHNFCYQCIYTWVQLRATCPLCLQPITAIIKNVRSIDDYDIEQVFPPQTDVFGEYERDIDMPDDMLLDYESSLDESMSMASDLEFYGDLSNDSIDNLQSIPHSSQESESQSSVDVMGESVEDFGSEDDDEVSDGSLPEIIDDEEDGEDDEDGDDENEEFFEDNDDEDYDYDDNNNEDNYEGNDDEDNVNFTDTCDDDDDDDDDESDRLSSARYSSSESDSEDRSHFQNFNFILDFDDSDSDQDYPSPPFTASYVYSCDYY